MENDQTCSQPFQVKEKKSRNHTDSMTKYLSINRFWPMRTFLFFSFLLSIRSDLRDVRMNSELGILINSCLSEQEKENNNYQIEKNQSYLEFFLFFIEWEISWKWKNCVNFYILLLTHFSCYFAFSSTRRKDEKYAWQYEKLTHSCA